MNASHLFSLGLLVLLSPTLSRAQEEKAPERWKAAIDEFAERDRTSPPEKGALLFVGSSSIRMWKLEESWPGTATVNNGFGGSTLADCVHHFERVLAPYDPSAIVIYSGDNDIARDLTPEQVHRDFESLVALISETHPEVPVILIAIKPSIARWELWPKMAQANALIRETCGESETLHYADIAAPMLEGREGPPSERWFLEDGLHLTKWGYEQWTGIVAELLRRAGVNAGG